MGKISFWSILSFIFLISPGYSFLKKKPQTADIATQCYGAKVTDNQKKNFPPKIPEGQPILILSVDGGGVRGLIPAIMIDAMEQHLKIPITQVVDVFAGTSAGAIVTGLLNVPDESGAQKFSAAQGIKLSGQMIRDIFKNTAFRSVRTLGGLAGAKYSAKPLESLLQHYIGNVSMSYSLKPLVITSFDLQRNEVFNFSTRHAMTWPEMFNLPVRMAIRASTAAPTYFKPFGCRLRSGSELRLTDGGVMAMTPELFALAEAETLYPGRSYIVVSLSTGLHKAQNRLKVQGSAAGSLPGMLRPLINATLDGQISASEHIMKSRKDVTYYRISVNVPKECSALDNASVKNMQCLTTIANQVVATPYFQKMLENIAQFIEKRKLSTQQTAQMRQESRLQKESIKRRQTR
jgi:uncharacterized protein